MEQAFKHGDRVEDTSGSYGQGMVLYLNGDPMPDGSGRHYDWPGYVCVEFDREMIAGEKTCHWYECERLHKVDSH